MEYGEPVNEQAAERAFAIALQLRSSGMRDIRMVAKKAVARAYCVCVTDDEDAAEQRLSNVHAELIDALERRLLAEAMKQEEK